MNRIAPLLRSIARPRRRQGRTAAPRRRAGALPGAGALILALAGLTPLPGQEVSAADGLEVDILSYNVNALPALPGDGLSRRMTEIGKRLARLHEDRDRPQVVLLQEAFDPRVRALIAEAGFPFQVRGPGRRAGGASPGNKVLDAVLDAVGVKGDTGTPLNSGLYILSELPVMEARFTTFDSACAGLDCFANKSILMARLRLPDDGGLIDVVTSHFNSHGSSGVPAAVSRAAHTKQVDILARFLKGRGSEHPLVLAGDFNVRPVPRYRTFRKTITVRDVGRQCTLALPDCTLADDTSPPEVRMQTNDKHFMRAGAALNLRPVHVARTFRGYFEGRPLSDHLGYAVRYRLTAPDPDS
ncbi:endonuclease/exonuclease/phosphatase family protein [Yunchengibacter salinarum]|uniref:endonuclease/exonuclease/phosphatase family protein n=1 Tax=Yunchengibacter salinarum TaxID=3133399 RepID=UPI0035B5D479